MAGWLSYILEPWNLGDAYVMNDNLGKPGLVNLPALALIHYIYIQ